MYTGKVWAETKSVRCFPFDLVRCRSAACYQAHFTRLSTPCTSNITDHYNRVRLTRSFLVFLSLCSPELVAAYCTIRKPMYSIIERFAMVSECLPTYFFNAGVFFPYVSNTRLLSL